jgi:hypothetical protein
MPDDMLHPPGPFDGMQCDGDGTVFIGFDVPGVVSKSGFACPPAKPQRHLFRFAWQARISSQLDGRKDYNA